MTKKIYRIYEEIHILQKFCVKLPCALKLSIKTVIYYNMQWGFANIFSKKI